MYCLSLQSFHARLQFLTVVHAQIPKNYSSATVLVLKTHAALVISAVSVKISNVVTRLVAYVSI